MIKSLQLLFSVLMISALIVIAPQPVMALDQNMYFLSFQTGSQDTSVAVPGIEQKDLYLDQITSTHGAVQEDRVVTPQVISFDFYRPSESFSSGFGIEMHRYSKPYTFQDGSAVTVDAVALLYGLSFYYRTSWFYPFFGFGSGEYTARVQESLDPISSGDNGTVSTVFEQVSNPFFYKIGFRIPIGSMGFIATQQYTSADMQVPTENAAISLGGSATLFGFYFGF